MKRKFLINGEYFYLDSEYKDFSIVIDYNPQGFDSDLYFNLEVISALVRLSMLCDYTNYFDNDDNLFKLLKDPYSAIVFIKSITEVK